MFARAADGKGALDFGELGGIVRSGRGGVGAAAGHDKSAILAKAAKANQTAGELSGARPQMVRTLLAIRGQCGPAPQHLWWYSRVKKRTRNLSPID
jgi:hypothetical protein